MPQPNLLLYVAPRFCKILGNSSLLKAWQWGQPNSHKQKAMFLPTLVDFEAHQARPQQPELRAYITMMARRKGGLCSLETSTVPCDILLGL